MPPAGRAGCGSSVNQPGIALAELVADLAAVGLHGDFDELLGHARLRADRRSTCRRTSRRSGPGRTEHDQVAALGQVLARPWPPAVTSSIASSRRPRTRDSTSSLELAELLRLRHVPGRGRATRAWPPARARRRSPRGRSSRRRSRCSCRAARPRPGRPSRAGTSPSLRYGVIRPGPRMDERLLDALAGQVAQRALISSSVSMSFQTHSGAGAVLPRGIGKQGPQLAGIVRPGSDDAKKTAAPAAGQGDQGTQFLRSVSWPKSPLLGKADCFQGPADRVD